MRIGVKIASLLSITLFSVCFDIQAKLSSSMLESILLINLNELKEISSNNDNQNRRSSIDTTFIEEQIEENSLTDLSDSIAGTFEASHGPPYETNEVLTQALAEAFILETTPSPEDFEVSLTNLVNFKDGTTLTNRSFISATKSLISAYVRAGGKFDDAKSLPYFLYNSVLPKVEIWGSSMTVWIKSLSQASIEAYLEEESSTEELSNLASSFASSTVDLISNPSPLIDQLDINDLSIDYLETKDNLTLEEKLDSGKNYSPDKTQLLQQLSVGISQGYFGFMDFRQDEGGLSAEDFMTFSQSGSTPNSNNNGKIETNIVTSFMNGLMDSATALGETKEVFLYDSIKAAANGFLIASTVATTSKNEYIDNKLHLEAAEMISQQISQSVVLHSEDQPDGTNLYTAGLNWVEVDRIAESASLGSAMGSQLATVLPKSLDFTNSWEVATNIRREIAKSVSKGSSIGSVNSSALLSTIINPKSVNETVLKSIDIEKVSRGTATGSMMGNTGLAIYYPTDQLVPIINFTAQGSAYGSTNANNLAIVEADSTESIDISVARQSALGSSLAAIFEPTVLLGLNPSQNANDRRTVDHLNAAAFGSTYGAILGLNENESEIISTEGKSQSEEPRNTEIKQATKQGAVEGALSGAKLSLGLEEINTDNLKSKTAMLKAINKANTKAASDSISNRGNQSLRTSSKDMLLLMKKFGINPRYTNPAKMYKRPVVVQVDEPTIDDETSDAINNASPL